MKLIRIDLNGILNEYIKRGGMVCVPNVCKDIIELIEIAAEQGFEIEFK